MYRYILFVFAITAGCSTAPGPVHMTEVECRLNSDCDVGSSCDPFLNLCGWDCTSDDECGVGEYCSASNGRCLREEVPPPPVMPEGTTALVVTFRPEQGILTPNESVWHHIGTLYLDSFGGDSVFRGTDVSGANIGLLGSVTLARDHIIVGEILAPTPACSCGSVRLIEPVTVRDSERVELEVWGLVPTITTLTGELTFGLDGSGVDAEAVDGGEFEIIVSQPYESRFRVLETYPMVIPQALSTTSLANGIEQDLYRIQVSSAVADTSLYIGSLTFRLSGFGEEGMVSDLGIRIGSSPLSRATYRIVRTSTGIELGPTDSVSGLSDQITVVFTEADGLLIAGSGHVITLTGTPSGMTSGTSLNVHFGDRVFSGAYNGVFGNMTSEGQINYADGRSVFPLVDPIVWTTRSVGGVYTGAWMISDLETVSTLTRP